MVGDRCTAHFPNPIPLIPTSIVGRFVIVCLMAIIRMIVHCKENKSNTTTVVADDSKISPNYGIAGYLTVVTLTTITIVISLPTVVLFYLFRVVLVENNANIEIACTLQNDLIGLIVPFILFFIVFLILATNSLRYTAREKFCELCATYVHPVASVAFENSTPRMLVMPAGRGLWLPPLVRVFSETAMESREFPPEVFALDAFETDMCSPGALDWLQVNTAFEGIDSKVRLIWSNFDTLPFTDRSVDCVVMPMGSTLQFFRKETKDITADDR